MADKWLLGYMEAALDGEDMLLGPSTKNARIPTFEALEQSNLAKRFFLRELVNRSDDIDLHRIWTQASSLAKYDQDWGNRSENLCWRIWHVAHKIHELKEGEMERSRVLKREKDEANQDTRAEFDGASGDHFMELNSGVLGGSEIFVLPSAEASTGSTEDKRLYIVMLSLHGLVRGSNMELGKDSDTGGQIKYVVEFAKALAAMPQVYRVDLLTRLICSPEVDHSYGEPVEALSGPEITEGLPYSGAYIVRIPFGPREQYIRKEMLWPHLSEFVDGALAHIVHMSKLLGRQIDPYSSLPQWPYVVHGHYADAGDAAALLSGALNVPMVMTGHSLGRNKLEQLLKQGRMSKSDINETYKIMRRIEAEEFSLDAAELVVTSTRQEIEQQWQLYDGYDIATETLLRKRADLGKGFFGRYMPRMAVIPPGMDFSKVVKSSRPHRSRASLLMDDDEAPSSPRSDPAVWADILRFLSNPSKPIILALARPDPKKNLVTLVKAYGECAELRDVANLVLVMGNRESIDEMPAGNAEVLTAVLRFIDKYDLYGLVSYPKHHRQSDVPDIYRLAAHSKGVFVNPALVEPFGLTLIEAAAHGLPIVATKNGGPVDIIEALDNGVLVDPLDSDMIGQAILRLITDRHLWEKCSRNGASNIPIYSWPGHCKRYLSQIAKCRNRHPQWKDEFGSLAEVDTNSGSLREDSLQMSLSLDLKGGSTSLRASDYLSWVPSLPEELGSDLPDSGELGEGNDGTLEDDMRLGLAAHELRKSTGLIVVAMDSFNESGQPTRHLCNSLKAAIADRNALMEPTVGIAVSTALPRKELMAYLKSSKIPIGELQILVVGSGSEIYYVVNDELVQDSDYESHIEYRWGGDGLRQTVARLLKGDEKRGGKTSGGEAAVWGAALQEDPERSSSKRLVYKIVNKSQLVGMHEMKRKLRMRGYRCHIVTCRSASFLHLIPLHASRAQALRYLFVRWGMGNMQLMADPGGDDSDFNELLTGIFA